MVPDVETSNFSMSSRKARVSAESYFQYVAQGNPQPDDEIAKKCRFRTGTSLFLLSGTGIGGEMLTTGERFPSFELQAHDGSVVKSSDLEGSVYLVYFYPKADTPGCTKEACTFRDSWSEVREADIQIFGVSYDTPAANRAFAEKFNIPFLLLSDSDKVLAEAAGAARFLIPVPKRISYLVGPKGEVLKSYPSVSASSHAQDVLEDFQSLRDK